MTSTAPPTPAPVYLQAASALTEVRHGGHCCGMTHIYSFPCIDPTDPTYPLAERPKKTPEKWAAFVRASPWATYQMNDSYPQQTAAERLKQMVSNIEDGILFSHSSLETGRAGRKNGIIEVVLTHFQAKFWEATLTDLGFKLVNENVNSNTTNTIKVYHRNSGAV